jgi:hypothetical protein
VLDEIEFKSDTKNAFDKIKEFSKNNIFINCSAMDSTQNIYTKGIAVERYEIEDYDKSVNQLSLAFSKKKLKIVSSCVRTRADIEMVKYNKSKTEEIKYASEKDGFVACLRTALIYYSINI